MIVKNSSLYRRILIGLLIGACGLALAGVPSFAQTSNPDTSQTDQSEEDWRKSRKKQDSTDIFEGLKNSRSSGRGINSTGPINPMDSLPDSSRRHLKRERAKAMAKAPIGTSVNTDYTPSAAAESDPDLKEQEKEAWSDMMSDINSPLKSGTADQATTPNTRQEAGKDNKRATPSILRGGSSASVADILAQIKNKSGGKTSPNANSSKAQTESAEQLSAQSQDKLEENELNQSARSAQPSSSSDSKTSKNEASNETLAAQSESKTTSRPQEAISPLERIQRDRNRASVEHRTSATDYMNMIKRKKKD